MALLNSSSNTFWANVVGVTPISKRSIKCPIAICETAWCFSTLVASLETEMHEPSVVPSQECTDRQMACTHTAVWNFATDADPLETSVTYIRIVVNPPDRLTATDAQRILKQANLLLRLRRANDAKKCVQT